MCILCLIFFVIYSSLLLASNQYGIVHSKSLNIYSEPNEESIVKDLKMSKGSRFNLLSQDENWIKASGTDREFYLYKPEAINYLTILTEDGSFLSNLASKRFFDIPFKILLFYIIALVAIAALVVIMRDYDSHWIVTIFSHVLTVLLLLFLVLYKKQYIDYWLFSSWHIYDLISWHTIKATFALLWNSIVVLVVIYSTILCYMCMWQNTMTSNTFKKEYNDAVTMGTASILMLILLVMAVALPIVIFVCSIFTDVVLDTNSFKAFFSSLWSWLTIKKGWIAFLIGLLICFYILYSLWISLLGIMGVKKISVSIVFFSALSPFLFMVVPVIVYDGLELLADSNFIAGLFSLGLIFVMMQGARSSSRSSSVGTQHDDREQTAYGVDGGISEDTMRQVDSDTYESPNIFDTNKYRKVGDNKYKKLE